jgi:hypothetical protein
LYRGLNKTEEEMNALEDKTEKAVLATEITTTGLTSRQGSHAAPGHYGEKV